MTEAPTPNPKELYKVAQGFFQNREWDSAAQFYRSTLLADPDHRQARYQLGQALVNNGDLDGGIEALTVSFTSDVRGSRTTLLKALVERAKAAHQRGESDQALVDCERALDISPNHGQAFQLQMSIWMRRGDNALLKDDFSAAADAYARAGDDVRASQVEKIHRWQDESDLEGQARSLELSRNWQAAASMYEKLLELAPKSEIKPSWAEALERCSREAELLLIFNRGEMALDDRDWNLAQIELLKLVNQRPDYHRGRRWAVEMLARSVKAASAHFTPNLPSGRVADAAPEVITTNNAHRIMRLARLGDGSVGLAKFASAGKYLAVGSSIGLYIYDAESLEFIYFIDTDRSVEAVAISAHGELAATGFDDGVVSLWNPADGAPLQKLRGHAQPVRSMDFNADGTYLATGSEDGSVRIWQTSDGTLTRQLEGRLEAVADIAFSSDGKLVAIAGADDLLRLRGVKDEQLDVDLAGHQSVINRVSFSPDDRLIASGSDDGEVRLWDVRTSEFREALRGHAGAIRSVLFSPHGRDLAVGLWNGTINVWKLSNGSVAQTIEGTNKLLLGMSYSSTGNTLVTTQQNDHAQLWRTEDGALLHSFDQFDTGIRGIAFDAHSQLLAAGQQDGSIIVFNVVDAAYSHTIRRHQNAVRSVVYSPGGKYLAAASEDGVVRVWQDERLVRSISTSADPVNALEFSGDDTELLVGAESGAIRIYDLSNGDIRFETQAHEAPLRQVRFSSGGSLFASACSNGVLKVWLSSNGSCLETFEGFSRNITRLAFSPEGRQLICGTAEGEIWIWDTTTDWNLSNKFEVLGGDIWAMDASPARTILATGDAEGTIFLWDYSRQGGPEKLLLGSFPGHSGEILDLKFTANGALLASAGTDGVIRIWGSVAG